MKTMQFYKLKHKDSYSYFQQELQCNIICNDSRFSITQVLCSLPNITKFLLHKSHLQKGPIKQVMALLGTLVSWLGLKVTMYCLII